MKNIKSGLVSNVFKLLTIQVEPSPAVEMDPNLAGMEFFSKENSSNWVVLEKWHEYHIRKMSKKLSRLSRLIV